MDETQLAAGGVGLGAARRILLAASDLRRFSVAEVAAHAEVATDVVEAFFREQDDLIEALTEPQGTSGPGGSLLTHRLRADQCRAVAAWLASPRGGYSSQERGEVMSESPSLLGMLEARVAQLALGVVDPGHFEDDLALAERQLIGAAASLRDAGKFASPIDPAEAERLDVARATIARLRGGHNPIPALTALAAPIAEAEAFIRRALTDWTVPDFRAAPEHTKLLQVYLSHHTPGSLIDALMAAARPHSAFFVAAALTLLDPFSDAEFRSATRACLAALLSKPDLVGQNRILTAAAVAAAVLDAEAAAKPLFEAILRAARAWPPHALSACCASLARLARPLTASPSQARRAAAYACQYLVNDAARLTNSDLLVLLPAAMWAEQAAFGPLLRRMAEALHAETSRVSGTRAVAIAARNFAMSLVWDGFARFDDQLESLLAHERGGVLIHVLNHPDHGALQFDDRHVDEDSDEPFWVGVGVRVQPALHTGQPAIRRNLSLDAFGEAGERLQNIIRPARQSRVSVGTVCQMLRQQALPGRPQVTA